MNNVPIKPYPIKLVTDDIIKPSSKTCSGYKCDICGRSYMPVFTVELHCDWLGACEPKMVVANRIKLNDGKYYCIEHPECVAEAELYNKIEEMIT